MKLYFAPRTCSLSPHIIAREAGLQIDLIRVDIRTEPHRTASGVDYADVNPKGYVPALELDDGQLLTEGVAIAQYLADLAPESGLAPPAGTLQRYRLQEWLTFVSSELHKMFSPWLFHPEYGEAAEKIARARIIERYAFLERHFVTHSYLLGDTFTVADAYAFAIIGWSQLKQINLKPFPKLDRYVERISARPKVQEAMRAEGLLEELRPQMAN